MFKHMEINTPDYAHILDNISRCQDPQKLKNFIYNANRKNADVVRNAAVRQLSSLIPDHKPGTLEHDFWQSLNAYETILREDRKTKVRLRKTREKVELVGIEQTISDWALLRLHNWAFNRLVEVGLADLTGEAVILRYPKRFSSKTRAAARKRLAEVNINVEDSIRIKA